MAEGSLVLLITCLCLPLSLLALQCNSTMSDIPSWDPAPYSCRNRCDQLYKEGICACDRFCVLYGDCCEDYQDECLNLTTAGDTSGESAVSAVASINAGNSASSTIASMNAGSTATATSINVINNGSHQLDTPGMSEDPFTEMSTNNVVEHVTRPLSQDQIEATSDSGQEMADPVPEMIECRSCSRLVSACPSPPANLPASGPLVFRGREIAVGEVGARCQTPWEEAEDEDVLRMMPVTDAVSGHHFANVYCLLCHGGRLQHAMPWAQYIVWDFKVLKDVQRPQPRDLYQLLQLARESGTKTVALPPEGVYARRCLPETSFSYLCDCPVLKEKCEQSQPSYIFGNGELFRNPSCLLCQFVAMDEKEYALLTPDVNSLVFSRNAFEFSTLMRWTTAGVTGDRAELKLSNPNDMRSRALGWQDMICTSRVSDRLGTVTPRASSTGGRIILTSMTPTDATSSSVDGDASTSKAPGKKANLSNGNEVTESDGDRSENSDKKKAMNDSALGQQNCCLDVSSFAPSTASRLLTDSLFGTDTECQQTVCLSGTPLVDGVCRQDLVQYRVYTKIRCTSPSNASLEPETTSPETNTSLEKAKATLSQAVNKLSPSIVPQSIVKVVRLGVAQNKCTWNITTDFFAPVEDMDILGNQIAIAYALQLAATESLRSELASVRQTLFVCTNTFNVIPGMLNMHSENVPCHAEALLHDCLPSAGGGRRQAGTMATMIGIVTVTRLLVLA